MLSELKTAHLQLLPWTDEYLPHFSRICSDPKVMFYITGGQPLTHDEAQKISNRSRRLWEEHGFGPWAAIEKESGRWIGRIGLNILEDWPGLHKVEFESDLDPEFWGRGLATEGAEAGVWFGFSVVNLERIISVTTPANAASRRVMEKAGLTLQGESYWRDTDVVWYAVDRREWDASSPAEPSATRLSRGAPELTENRKCESFAMELKPIAKPLLVKTQQPVEKLLHAPLGASIEASAP